MRNIKKPRPDSVFWTRDESKTLCYENRSLGDSHPGPFWTVGSSFFFFCFFFQRMIRIGRIWVHSGERSFVRSTSQQIFCFSFTFCEMSLPRYDGSTQWRRSVFFKKKRREFFFPKQILTNFCSAAKDATCEKSEKPFSSFFLLSELDSESSQRLPQETAATSPSWLHTTQHTHPSPSLSPFLSFSPSLALTLSLCHTLSPLSLSLSLSLSLALTLSLSLCCMRQLYQQRWKRPSEGIRGNLQSLLSFSPLSRLGLCFDKNYFWKSRTSGLKGTVDIKNCHSQHLSWLPSNTSQHFSFSCH